MPQPKQRRQLNVWNFIHNQQTRILLENFLGGSRGYLCLATTSAKGSHIIRNALMQDLLCAPGSSAERMCTLRFVLADLRFPISDEHAKKLIGHLNKRLASQEALREGELVERLRDVVGAHLSCRICSRSSKRRIDIEGWLYSGAILCESCTSQPTARWSLIAKYTAERMLRGAKISRKDAVGLVRNMQHHRGSGRAHLVPRPRIERMCKIISSARRRIRNQLRHCGQDVHVHIQVSSG